MLLVLQPAPKQQGVNSWRPFVMPAAKCERMLILVKFEMRAEALIGVGIEGIVILEVIAGMIVLIFDEGQGCVLRGNLLFDGRVPLDAVEIVVGPDAIVVLVIEVQG